MLSGYCAEMKVWHRTEIRITALFRSRRAVQPSDLIVVLMDYKDRR